MKQIYKKIKDRAIDILIIAMALAFVFIPMVILLALFQNDTKIEPETNKYDTFIIKRDSLKTIVKELNNEENEAIKHIDDISNDSVYILFKELVK